MPVFNAFGLVLMAMRARMSPVRVGVRAALKKILLPALCVACDGVLAGDDRGLCGACRAAWFPMSEPCCPACGHPSDSETDLCLGCVVSSPPQDATILWGAYEGYFAEPRLALKHGRHDELARPLGRRLSARIGLSPWFDEITIVTAVPVARSSTPASRRQRRGSPGRGVARTIDRPIADPALHRHGLGRQAGRTRAQRIRLPSGSFSAQTA